MIHTYMHSYTQGYVYVDAHVLCTPIIADIERDGKDEVIFAVSYYFDRYVCLRVCCERERECV